MKVTTVGSGNSESVYILKSFRSYGKSTSKIVEKLGTMQYLTQHLETDRDGVLSWARKRAKELTADEEKNKDDLVYVDNGASTLIEYDNQVLYNSGYLFLQKLYYQLGLNDICKDITKRHKFTYDLNAILSSLIYGRILYPTSKRSTMTFANTLLEKPNYNLYDIYRALKVICEESDYIQSQLYKNSLKVSNRNTGVLYYDCTNYFFEIESADGDKQYAVSKQNQPLPVTQMGLFMDGDGIPLAFCITPGNQNEQTTLTPLEKKILQDYELSKFIVCTDAGLASLANRKFNSVQNRAFITTQSIKKLKKHLKEWCLNKEGWSNLKSTRLYTLEEIEKLYDDPTTNRDKLVNAVFYKEKWIKENDFEQRIIVTFSLKYKFYQQKIRDQQLERAEKAITTHNKNKQKISSKNDFKRFIKETNITTDGEVADKAVYSLDNDKVISDSNYDGFYAVCTNLEDKASDIIRVNSRRWEIEECFRIMKSEFKARPMYLSRDDRIKAHLLTCVLALIIYRYLEKKLDYKYTIYEILDKLKEMRLFIDKDEYRPAYKRNTLTDDLHTVFEFRTDFKTMTNKKIKSLIKFSKQ